MFWYLIYRPVCGVKVARIFTLVPQPPRLIQAGGVLAQVDALASLAELAARQNYCRPEVVAEPVLEIEAGKSA